MFTSVRIEVSGPVTTVVIDRPEARNAVDGPTAAALADAFRAFDADETRGSPCSPAKAGTFCAGADLKKVGTPEGNRVDEDGDGPMGPTRLRLTKPVIAAIEGYAVAGGLELAIWCDLRVAAEDAVLGVFCRRWGVPLIDGGTVRLPRLIGTGRALDLILTGRPVAARGGAGDGPGRPRRTSWQARAEAEALARELASCRRTACATTGCRCSSRRAAPRPRRWPTSSRSGSVTQAPGAGGCGPVRAGSDRSVGRRWAAVRGTPRSASRAACRCRRPSRARS